MRTVTASTLLALALAFGACGGDDESASKDDPAKNPGLATPEESKQAQEAADATKKKAAEAKKSGDWIGEVQVKTRKGKQVLVVESRSAAKKLCDRLKAQGLTEFGGQKKATIVIPEAKDIRCNLGA